jgi:FkbM family methyltransferase
VRVLYLSHTASVSGGERSLLDLLRVLPRDSGSVVAGPPGDLADSVRELGWPYHEIPGTDASLKLHPVFTPRAVGRLLRAARATRRLARRTNAEVVHANSIRAGIVGVLASAPGGPPVVVHVRDRLPPTLVSRLALRLIEARAAEVVANSRYTAAGMRRRCEVVHSPVDLERFRPRNGGESNGRAGPVLGIVGQLTPWKGQDDAIRVVARVREQHPGARLLIVGSAKFVSRETRYDNESYVTRLQRLVDAEDLAGSVRFLGEREDVEELLHELDLLLVPSWEEPFGRVVVEALASGVPVAATNTGGPAEILTHGEDGLLLPPRRPELWAEEVGRLLSRPEARAAMVRRGQARAVDFGLGAHARAIRGVHERVRRDAERAHGAGPLKRTAVRALPAPVLRRLRVAKFERERRRYPRRVVRHRFGPHDLRVRIGSPYSERYDFDWPDLAELALLRRGGLRPGARVFDLGASCGVIAALLAKAVGPEGHVVALEAHPDDAALARENRDLNGLDQLEVVHAAVARTSGTVVFGANGSVDDGSRRWGDMSVPSWSIDDLADRHGRPDVVFIDVEGYELEALEGAAATMEAGPDWFVEVHGGEQLRRYGGSVEAVLERFDPDRYVLHVALDGLGPGPNGTVVCDTSFEPLESTELPLSELRFFLVALRRRP